MSLMKYIFIILVVWSLVWECAYSTPSVYEINNKALHAHVAFLSSNALEGRLTGAKGEKIATQYVADIFQHLGLEPAGDHGTFFQEFNFTSGVSLGKHNSLSILSPNESIKRLELGQAWRPLSFSANHSFKCAELVFAGYGITAPSMGNLPAYDSYHGLNVKNKWVIVFRYEPERMSDEQRRHLSSYASLRYKAFIAKEKGAKGIIFVSGPNSKVKNELIPLSLDTALSNSGIFAISVTDVVINEMLQNDSRHLTLQQVQNELDKGQLHVISQLRGIKLIGEIDMKVKNSRGRNVLAKLKLSSGNKPIMIVGAHIDHLGYGELNGSRSRDDEKRIHNGADDNASGVASVLESAIKLSHLKAQGKLHGNEDILFGIWSGEELGLLGSDFFIKSFIRNTPNHKLRPMVDSYINLDMVGRLRTKLVIQGVGSSSSWKKIITQVNQGHAMTLILQDDPYLPTDSTSFYLHGVPTLNFFTGSHDEYHTSRDKINKLNFDGMRGISNFLVDLISAVESKSNLISYQHIPKSNDHSERGRRIYLGTIPDYTSTNLLGVKLSGVTKGSPADTAGLKEKDVIIELAGNKIRDIYEYTFVLNALHPEQPVALVVRRGLKKLALTIKAQTKE